MDKRIVKTKKAIKDTFLQLRAKKPLEKITVKELCELAYINKSTFYCHYKDIYDLSDSLELEIVHSIIKSISKNHEYTLDNPELFTKELCLAFLGHKSIINILFSGKEQSHLADQLENEIKKIIFSRYPQYINDIEKNILISYCIQGAYHAYIYNQNADIETLIHVIENIAKQLQPLC